MPRACRVESHVYCYLAEKREAPRREAVASTISFHRPCSCKRKYHGTSPWHLSNFEAKPRAYGQQLLIEEVLRDCRIVLW